MERVVVVDHGAGNLPSVVRALEHIGCTPQVTGDVTAVAGADRVILPGVGAFGDCAAALRRAGLDEALATVRRRERPILGICVGLQLLFDESEEFGPIEGLGWFGGPVRRLDDLQGIATADLKIPHMGWSRVRRARSHPLLAGCRAEPWFYFVHSYAAAPDDPSVILADVPVGGGAITAAVASGAVAAAQFHPEKSAEDGVAFLQAFLRWTP